MIFSPGQSVVCAASRQHCVVEQFLGGGGQGEVYRAKFAGEPVALKWYLPHAATAMQRQRLETIIKKGPPTPKFLWPIELAAAGAGGPGAAGFGYIMPLREPRFRSIASLMRNQLDTNFRALATAGFELAHSFLQLHSKGLCYRDIAFGNVFLDPGTGEILICDNDNVAVDGDTAPGILGTPRFMAPEIVLRQAVPSIQTDLYSLAVLLFYIFFVHHPLEGRRELAIHSFDLPAMTRLFGSEPLFIFDPDDDSNAPVPGAHDNALTYWPLYPRAFRALFTRAFTEGLRDAVHGRVREGEWRAAAIHLRDALFYCGACGSESCYDPGAGPRLSSGAGGAGPQICWNCQRPLQLPFRIKFPRHLVMLNHDTQLFPHHLDDQRQYDFSAAVAAVVRNPAQPDIWGLSNLSADTWTFHTVSNPAPQTVEPGRSLTLISGLFINFGKVEAEIRY
ncbi:MAG TPA: hypothetical protein VIC54_06090 [Terriglobales bacterium]